MAMPSDTIVMWGDSMPVPIRQPRKRVARQHGFARTVARIARKRSTAGLFDWFNAIDAITGYRSHGGDDTSIRKLMKRLWDDGYSAEGASVIVGRAL